MRELKALNTDLGSGWVHSAALCVSLPQTVPVHGYPAAGGVMVLVIKTQGGVRCGGGGGWWGVVVVVVVKIVDNSKVV